MPGSDKPRPALYGLRTGRPKIDKEAFPDEAPDDDAFELTLETIVEGAVVVMSWDDDKKLEMEQFVALGLKLGFKVRQIKTNSEIPGQSGCVQRWTEHKVPLATLCSYLERNPGASFDMIMNEIYLPFVSNTSDAHMKAAIARGRLAIHRLTHSKKVVKLYDEFGERHFALYNHPPLPHLFLSRKEAVEAYYDKHGKFPVR